MSTKLGQHCIEGYCILYVVYSMYTPCCPNTFVIWDNIALQENYLCNIGLSTETCFCRTITYAILSWSAWLAQHCTKQLYTCTIQTMFAHTPQSSQFFKYGWDSIAQENYWYNNGPEHADILSQENQLIQICLVTYCFLVGFNINWVQAILALFVHYCWPRSSTACKTTMNWGWHWVEQ